MKNELPVWASWLILLMLAFTWGSSFILMKYSLFDSNGEALYSPIQVACMRLAVAALALLPVSIKRLNLMRSIKNWPYILIVAFFGNGLPAFLFTMAQEHLPSAYAGMLNSLVPLFTLIVGVVLFRNKVRSLQVMGVVLGLVGALGLIYAGGKVTGEVNGYAWLIVLATVCYAISVNTIGNRLGHMQSVQIAALALFCAGLPTGIYLFTTDFTEVLTQNPGGPRGLMFAAILAVFGTALALVFFNKLVQQSGALLASSVTYIIPIFAVLWGVWDGETLNVWQFVAGAVILSGVYLVNRGKKKSVEG